MPWWHAPRRELCRHGDGHDGRCDADPGHVHARPPDVAQRRPRDERCNAGAAEDREVIESLHARALGGAEASLQTGRRCDEAPVPSEPDHRLARGVVGELRLRHGEREDRAKDEHERAGHLHGRDPKLADQVARDEARREHRDHMDLDHNAALLEGEERRGAAGHCERDRAHQEDHARIAQRCDQSGGQGARLRIDDGQAARR
mmetsp:Transcript_31339/g.101273  ORF Transcript_31339/g.101273 Transcript_31339/m.101273 type:complete len:203 (+) Transcript_31339:305-913(+)|eukprot:scaffold3189_cov138-Isochrysis_galbana.AAC.10